MLVRYCCWGAAGALLVLGLWAGVGVGVVAGMPAGVAPGFLPSVWEQLSALLGATEDGLHKNPAPLSTLEGTAAGDCGGGRWCGTAGRPEVPGGRAVAGAG